MWVLCPFMAQALGIQFLTRDFSFAPMTQKDHLLLHTFLS